MGNEKMKAPTNQQLVLLNVFFTALLLHLHHIVILATSSLFKKKKPAALLAPNGSVTECLDLNLILESSLIEFRSVAVRWSTAAVGDQRGNW